MNKEMVFLKLKNSIEENISKMKNLLDEINKKEEDSLEIKEILNFAKKDSTKLTYLSVSKMNMLIDNIVEGAKAEEYKKELARAKFLIENAKKMENSGFTQFKDAIKDLDNLYNEISNYYERTKDNKSEINKKEVENIINTYNDFLSLFDENGFTKKISDITSFVNILSSISLSEEEENIILKDLFMMTITD